MNDSHLYVTPYTVPHDTVINNNHNTIGLSYFFHFYISARKKKRTHVIFHFKARNFSGFVLLNAFDCFRSFVAICIYGWLMRKNTHGIVFFVFLCSFACNWKYLCVTVMMLTIGSKWISATMKITTQKKTNCSQMIRKNWKKKLFIRCQHATLLVSAE